MTGRGHDLLIFALQFYDTADVTIPGSFFGRWALLLLTGEQLIKSSLLLIFQAFPAILEEVAYSLCVMKFVDADRRLLGILSLIITCKGRLR